LRHNAAILVNKFLFWQSLQNLVDPDMVALDGIVLNVFGAVLDVFVADICGCGCVIVAVSLWLR
jgi:hypothetical protein